MTLFGLIRHGLTTWNEAKKIQGQEETPLSETGIAQVTSWQQPLARYTWDMILTSPLQRAVHTGQILNTVWNLPMETHKGLIEQDWGDWVGTNVATMRTTQPGVVEAQEALGWDFTPPGGESRKEVLDRALLGLTEAAERHSGKRILVVSHLGVLKSIVAHLTNRNFMPSPTDSTYYGSGLTHKRGLHFVSYGNGNWTPQELNIKL